MVTGEAAAAAAEACLRRSFKFNGGLSRYTPCVRVPVHTYSDARLPSRCFCCDHEVDRQTVPFVGADGIFWRQQGVRIYTLIYRMGQNEDNLI